MYFYDLQKKAFLVTGLHQIPDTAKAVSEKEFNLFVEGRNKGREIVLMGNTLTLTPSRPSQAHEWNGIAWEISDTKQAELLAQKQQQFITNIDDKAASIYNIWTRFETEYMEREAAAIAFKENHYRGDVSRYISDFAAKAGLDNQTAADLILTQANGLKTLQVELANQRMRKYELKRPDLTETQMQVIYDDIIQQMEKLAEAYQNG